MTAPGNRSGRTTRRPLGVGLLVAANRGSSTATLHPDTPTPSVSLRINGVERTLQIEPRMTLLEACVRAWR